MSRKPREPIVASQLWICMLCAREDGTRPAPEFDGPPALVAHFREAHPERISEDGRLLARRHPTAFLDGEGFAVQQEAWKQGDVVIATAAHTIPRGRWW